MLSRIYSKKEKILALLAILIVIVSIVIFKQTKNSEIATTEIVQIAPEPQVQNIENNPVVVASQIPAKVTPPKPLISAESYLVANLLTEEVYASHNPGTVFPIASLTKLLTAIIARQNMPSDQKITITDSMLAAYGDAGHLKNGEIFTVSELIYPLLLESSNDAAEALAQTYGYSAFIEKMNAFARNLSMTHTSFKDASGLSPKNYSNAKDLFIFTKYLYHNEKELLKKSREIKVELASSTEHGAHIFVTINPFPYDPHFLGGKTGRTDEAKESMISIFQYEHGSVIYPVAVIVLRSDFSNREIDSSILFEKAINLIHKK